MSRDRRAAYRRFADLANTVLRDPERAARVGRIKEEVMAEQEREWCIVANCDDEVIVHRRDTLRAVDGGSVEVEVPFCRGHGPQAGGDV